MSISERAASSSFRELAGSAGFTTSWSDRRVDPISLADAHWLRTRWLRRQTEDGSTGVFQSTWDSTVGSEGWPEVMMVHDMIPEMTLRPKRNVFHAQVTASRKRALASASAIVAVSKTTARDLGSIYPEVIDRTHVIRHGPTLGEVQPANIESVASRWDTTLSPGEFYLYVGRRRGYKNFAVVRDLFDTSTKASEWRLIAVGGETPTSEELHPSILFVPYASDAELAALYRSARALIYPSRYEGFGLPVLEAMSLGCPVVSSDADALREVGGDASIYFDPRSVGELLSALERVDSLDEAAHVEQLRRNVARFSWAESASRLVDLYRSLAP